MPLAPAGITGEPFLSGGGGAGARKGEAEELEEVATTGMLRMGLATAAVAVAVAAGRLEVIAAPPPTRSQQALLTQPSQISFVFFLPPKN